MNVPARELSKGYLPTLDGWRAVAILAVIFFHDKVHAVGRFSLKAFHDDGHYGVDLFFAISGILICTRLLEEERLKGAIDLRGFYIRRVFRIQPAAWTYLAAIGLLMVLHVVHRAPKLVLFSLLTIRNYVPAGEFPQDWYTVHFWSLAVEEHFYLLLPGFLVLFRKHRFAILAAIVLILEGWRVFVLDHPRFELHWLSEFRTDLTVGGILLASAVALLLRRPGFRAGFDRWLRPWVAIPIFAAVAIWMHVAKSEASHFALQCALPLLIVSTMLHPATVTGRILEFPALRFIGRISYSIYLWQMLFFPFLYFVTPPHWALLAQIQNSGLRYVAVFAMSLLSYYLVEKPMVRVGHRLAKSRKLAWEIDWRGRRREQSELDRAA